MFANLGREDGMILTRAAFAVMLKMANLVDTFEELVEDFQVEFEDCPDSEIDL